MKEQCRNMASTQTDRGVPLSTLSPKYLHTNSTSHTWPFSAIAELIDNAYDPDVNAQHFWIDKTVVSKEECLSFMDDGYGLDYQTMHKMLSFGYSDKVAHKGVQPIGIYGNGFKSGSMRLGKDAIVFSKSTNTMCIGMLSQTYLKEIGAEQIIVPIVCFEQREKTICVKDEHKASLQDILRYSPFQSESDLLNEVNAIGPSWSGSKSGTRIIIWNLRRTSQGGLEIDFNDDRYDIRMPSDIYQEMNDISHIPASLFSLRAYCSILYLKPRLQIMIRGKKVKSQLIAKSLAHSRKDHYRPSWVNKRIPITFGYNTNSKDQYGIMMYHKNRLIKAYERVGCQLKADRKGVGVIGIIECNFLDPTHNKQSFEENDKYRKTMTSLGIKLEEYWKEIRYRRSKEDPTGVPVEDTIKRPDQNWVQCDDCSRWRKLPDGIDCSKLPDKWFCYLNPDPQFRSCQVEEEPEDSDDEEPSYCKTYKQQEREEKRLQVKKIKEEKELREQQHLQRQHESILKQLHNKVEHSIPVTPRSRKNRDSIQGGSPLAPSSISQAACSPSTSKGLPIISNVCSLATVLREKRQYSNPPSTTAKRQRLSRVQGNDASPQSSPSIPIDDDTDDTDDDLVILEGASTPKPKTNSAMDKVKTERTEAECDVNMLLECSDDAAVDDPPEMAQSGPSAQDNSSTAPPVVASITTQTEVPKINMKKEKTGEESTDKTENGYDRTQSMFKITVVKEEDLSQPVHNGITSGRASPDTENSSEAESPCASPSLLASDFYDRQTESRQVSELKQVINSLKQQVHQLQSQLEELQRRPDTSQIDVKKEPQDQHVKERQNTVDYKSMFENARNKINELIKDKEALLAAAEVKSSTDQSGDMDDMALQVDCLMQELDERNKERELLLTQLQSAEEQNASLSSECESLRLNLQQIKNKAAACKAVDSSAQTDSQENETISGTSSSHSLIALRHNVGRLLVTHHVPALDLDQVNFDCNVIDEILEQVLNDGSGNTALSDDRK